MATKKLEYEQRGPMAPFAHDSIAPVFEEVKKRLGLVQISERERLTGGYSGGILTSYHDTDGKPAMEFFFMRLDGETDNTVVRRRLYFDESLMDVVSRVLDEKSETSTQSKEKNSETPRT